MQCDFLTPAQAAEQIKMSVDFVLEEIKRGRLISYRFGRYHRILIEDLEKYISNCKQEIEIKTTEERTPTKRRPQSSGRQKIKYIPGKTFFDLNGNLCYRE